MFTGLETILLISLPAFLASSIIYYIYFIKEIYKTRLLVMNERQARIDMGRKCLRLMQITFNDVKTTKRTMHIMMDALADLSTKQESEDVGEDRHIDAAGSRILDGQPE